MSARQGCFERPIVTYCDDLDHQVGVAIMVGSMFMAMVGAELLYDHICDKIREIFKQQKPAPDIERLHPAELVGTFSRYK